jgi:hypothetical protein
LRVHERFNLAGMALDPHQGEHLAELLEREGVPVIRTPQTTSSLQEQATAMGASMFAFSHVPRYWYRSASRSWGCGEPGANRTSPSIAA